MSAAVAGLFDVEVAEKSKAEREAFCRTLTTLATVGVRPEIYVGLIELCETVTLTLEERRFLLGPLVVHLSAWNDTAPKWFVSQARAERLELVLVGGSELPVGPTELAAVMYGGMMDAPQGSGTTRVYLWAAAQAAAKHYGRELTELWKSLYGEHEPLLSEPELLRMEGHWLLPFASDIRRKVVEAQRQRESSAARRDRENGGD